MVYCYVKHKSLTGCPQHVHNIVHVQQYCHNNDVWLSEITYCKLFW